MSGACLERYYCSGGTNAERPENDATEFGNVCPAGSYCQPGVSTDTQCPPGTYQPNAGAAANTECLACPPGSYCQTSGSSAPTGDCNAGFYCEGGNSVPSPATNICAIGYYCPAGSVQQIECDEGNYQDASQQSICPACPANQYCFDTNSPQDCEAGYYCPGSNQKKACFPGKYGQTALAGDEPTACDTCPAGRACENFATTTNSQVCSAGYFCAAGSISSIPKNVTHGGGRCTIGNICPEGSSTETTCPLGKYCNRVGLADSVGNCEAGYYCTGGTTRQNPRGTGGNICSNGHYCPEGSSAEVPCPIGTYRDAEGGTVLSDCFECPEGLFCPTEATVTPTANVCAAGFYCPEGQEVGSPTAYACPAGYECPAGATIAIKCELGQYQPDVQQDHCEPCPAGSYCDGSDPSTHVVCPPGYFCPANTRYSTEHPCPEGTYNDLSGITQQSDCKACPVGYFCDQKGQTTFSKKLPAGYFSENTGLSVPNPTNIGTTQGTCLTGHYCEEGTSTPTACPAGTYNDARGATSSSDCLNCPPGEYCSQGGWTYAELVANPTIHGTCDPGFVCYPGSTVPNPNDNIMGIICPRGYYCPAGTFAQIPCPTGSYAPNQEQSVCTDCPAGQYCSTAAMSTTFTCTQGHYCPLNTPQPLACPVGTYNTNTGSQASTDCTPCPAQYYCDEEGMVDFNTNKRCAAGYICQGGADSAYPITTLETENNHKCPTGHFCVQGATSKSQCLAGTFQNSFAQSSCKDCPPGYYCGNSGLSAPDGPCDAGSMCYGGATTAAPTDGTTGEVCPIGAFCEAGSAKSVTCADGTKSTATGLAVCTNCDAGTWCTGSVEYACPSRRYCVAGSVRGQICDAGTYNDGSVANLTQASDCSSCPARYYCIDGIAGSDFCEAGYICGGGATSPTQTGVFGTDTNYICPEGRYCLKAGATNTNGPTTCSDSKYTYGTGNDALDDCLSCAAGTYCPTTSFSPFACPAGSFCIRGSTTHTQCPINTVRTTTNAEYERHCAQCPLGFFCNAVGLATTTGADCSTGKFCPIGTSAEVNCPSGYYRNSVGAGTAADCTQCPVGYYCPEGSVNPTACVNGQRCEAGSSLPKVCEAGVFCQVVGGTPYMTFTSCTAGYHCPQGATAEVACAGLDTSLCPAGSRFEGGQSTTCPAGQYLSGSLCKF